MPKKDNKKKAIDDNQGSRTISKDIKYNFFFKLGYIHY